MPNGGSDCCGTCWFNRANGGKKGSDNHDHRIPSYCEIRDLPIKDPSYTYCSNHPYRTNQRVSVPLGPVYVHVSDESGREIWVDAPDTEDVRRQLLRFLEDLGNLSDGYPFYGEDLMVLVVRELERLREPRAIPILEHIAHELRREGEAWDGIQNAIARIRRAVRRIRSE